MESRHPGAPPGACLNPMRLASPDIARDAVLTVPMAVTNIPPNTELRPALQTLIIRHRLRAPVTGAHLVHKKLLVWEARPCSTPEHCELRVNGVPRLLPPVERFPPVPGEPRDVVARLINLNPPFSAVEGYILVIDDEQAELRPGCWAVADRGSDLADPVHGHRGVLLGWAYIGIPVRLDIARKRWPVREVQRVDELPLRRQTINALHWRGIEGLDQLLQLSHRTLRCLPGVGAVAEQEIDAVLAMFDLHLPAEDSSR